MLDPEQFATAAVDPLDTEYAKCPEGDFQMMFEADSKMLVPRKIEFQRDGKQECFYQLPLRCVVLDEKVKADMGRDKVTVQCPVSLDLKDDGSLDASNGKNVYLGQIRDALDQNTPGWAPMQLLGAGPFIGKVKHRADKKRPGVSYAEVVMVTKLK